MYKNPLSRSLKLLRTAVGATRRIAEPVRQSPDEALGDLFRLVQLSRIHPDGKTFVDQVPSKAVQKVVREYHKASLQDDFDLTEFINKHFSAFSAAQAEAPTVTQNDPEAYVSAMWDTLTRQAPESKGSLLALPKPYVVPGGRFMEQYYWDTYFTMLGLEASGRSDLSDGMMNNIQHMFTKFGFIPTGNRTYYLSRSQPPFYLHMIRLIAHRKGHFRYLLPRLPYLLMEYSYWTRNTPEFLTMSRSHYRRLVKMPNGQALSRYYDGKNTARPESFREDVETAALTVRPETTYRHLRAGAESGWDFSSRWFARPDDLTTIRTTEVVPIDLNCLLYELELGLAEAYKKLLQMPIAAYYTQKAKKRRQTINKYMWDETDGFYFDWHHPTGKRTKTWSLAGVYPLYCGLASPEQAARVAEAIEEKFLKPGGVVTTLSPTTQQWDWPNGWAPLQWTTIIGLRRYGFHTLADSIKYRWMAANEAFFSNHGRFVEKYNVVDPTEHGGGGEYELQIGFGWTNGVFMALRRDLDKKLAKKIAVASALGATTTEGKQPGDTSTD
ncbi:MAG TPA: trehalase family glycosidase [Candidatus Saccharimonadales bacterium]|jgi:alpha,alpha-trehalase